MRNGAPWQKAQGKDGLECPQKDVDQIRTEER